LKNLSKLVFLNLKAFCLALGNNLKAGTIFPNGCGHKQLGVSQHTFYVMCTPVEAALKSLELVLTLISNPVLDDD
jgi:hypothetical protein